MFLFLKSNIQFLILLILWLITGMYLPAFSIVLIPLSLLLLFYKQMHQELILGFFFILTLSDSRYYALSFAADVKNIYIVLLAVFFILDYKRIKHKISFVLYIVPFILIAIFCIQYSPQVNIAIQKTLSYFLLFLILPNYISLIIEKHGIVFFRNIIWFVVTLLCYGLLLNFFDPYITNLVGRYRGILGNPNGLGIYLVLFTILFYVINTLYENTFSKQERIFIYIVCFLNLYMCGSRSSLIATLLFLLLSNFYSIDRFLGFVIFAVLLFSYQFISANIDGIIIALGLEQYFRLESLEQGSGRLVAWEFAWNNIQKNFFIGKGFNYTEYLFKLNYLYLSKLNHQGAAHNAYLTIWLDTGLVGLLAFMSGFIGLFFKISKVSPLVFPLLYAVFFSNQFESWLTASLNPFTIQLLIILSIIYYKGFYSEDEISLNSSVDNENENDIIPIY